MDAELRVRTCRLIEQMRRQPEHACRLGLEDVSVCRAKQAKAPQVRATGSPAGLRDVHDNNFFHASEPITR